MFLLSLYCHVVIAQAEIVFKQVPPKRCYHCEQAIPRPIKKKILKNRQPFCPLQHSKRKKKRKKKAMKSKDALRTSETKPEYCSILFLKLDRNTHQWMSRT